MASPLDGKKIGFLGAGAMASAMMKGLIAAGVPPASLSCSDPWDVARDRAEALGITTASNAGVAAASDVIVVAVKPGVVPEALASVLTSAVGKLVVSIAAGVPIATLEASLPAKARVVRTMPNTPCLVGEAAVGLARGTRATDADADVAEALFTGTVVRVDEKHLNAVTALSGSGPAYCFLFIEALADAGVRAGLPRAVALQLAAQTVKGSAAMQIGTGQHPGVLKDQVCSPGGTTIAGVEALEQNGLRYAAMSAVAAAKARADEMSAAAK
mmetsp:Transcript_23576/g.70657  ORF Transcript_23576/g.70657 Transcript_23576/m.70657 type:complete len:271 (+) Transcript_23576:123-935(+)